MYSRNKVCHEMIETYEEIDKRKKCHDKILNETISR